MLVTFTAVYVCTQIGFGHVLITQHGRTASSANQQLTHDRYLVEVDSNKVISWSDGYKRESLMVVVDELTERLHVQSETRHKHLHVTLACLSQIHCTHTRYHYSLKLTMVSIFLQSKISQ